MKAFQCCVIVTVCVCCGIAAFGERHDKPSRELSQKKPPAVTGLQDSNAIVQGAVTNARHEPLSGVAVSAVFLSHREANDPLAGSTVTVESGHTLTDASGRFHFRIRRSTSQDIALELSAYVVGYGVALSDLDLGRISHDVTLVLPKATAIATTVLRPNGEPLAGATIKLGGIGAASKAHQPEWYTSPTTGLSSWPGPYVTDDDGNFALIGNVSIEKMELEIDDERVARQRWIVATGNGVKSHILRTMPPRYVDGELISGDSRMPLGEATVVLTSFEDKAYIGSLVAKTDALGRFSLRPFVGNELDIRVNAVEAQYEPLRRSIPWLEGTTTQRMVLTAYGRGFEPQDGTTMDGRLAGTIDSDYPSVQVIEHSPNQPLKAQISGTIVVEGSLKSQRSVSTGAISGLIAIDAETGRWHMLVEDGRSPRVSPNGKYLSFCTADYGRHLQIVELKSLSKPRRINGKCDGPAGWMPSSNSLIANINDPPPHDYYGELYWATETEKWRFDRFGNRLGVIKVPPRYDVYDVSRDGRLLAMHWDTHASLTGAQLYTAHVDGSNLMPVARKRYQYYWYPRFSPDGKKLLAKHLDAHGGDVSVHAIALDGSKENSILLNNGFAPEVACWSPDGNYIAVGAYQDAAFSGNRKLSKLFVVNSRGTHIKEVVLSDVDELRITSIDWTAEPLITE